MLSKQLPDNATKQSSSIVDSKRINYNFIDEFLDSSNVKDVKETLSSLLLEYFEYQEEKGNLLPTHQCKVLFDFKILSSLLDHLQELQIARYGIN